MAIAPHRYDLLAGLFDYPENVDYTAMLDRCLGLLNQDCPAAAEALRPLREHVATLTIEQAQELYTRTFDINPVCTLEVGWHIYGEDYARGALLVKMRERLRELNLPESTELPDHLTHVLALLGRLAGEDGDTLAAHYVIPALGKMLEGMKEEAPYRALLVAVLTVVKQDHDVEAVPPRERKPEPPDSRNPLPVFGSQGCTKR